MWSRNSWGSPVLPLPSLTPARHSALLVLAAFSLFLSLQASFGSRDSSATIQGYNCPSDLQAAWPFLGVEEKAREAGLP